MIVLFKINHSVEIPEVGTQPQVQTKWLGPTDFWAPNSYTMTPLKGPIEFDIVFPVFEIAKYAELTDWVGVGGGITINYLMVSTRLFDLLKTFQMDEYQYFPAPIQTPHGIVDYHLIYFPWPREDDFIDWPKSTFRRVTASGDSFLVQFNNTKERQFAKNAHELQIDNIVVRTEQVTMDVFRFAMYELGFYVSARLKEAMIANGMTGIRYERAEWLDKSNAV